MPKSCVRKHGVIRWFDVRDQRMRFASVLACGKKDAAIQLRKHPAYEGVRIRRGSLRFAFGITTEALRKLGK